MILKKIYLFLRDSLNKMRVTFYRLRGAKIGKDVIIWHGKLSFPYNITIGDNSVINEGCVISAFDSIKIGRSVLIGPYCAIYDSDHSMPLRNTKIISKSIEIGDETWIGCHVIILKGVCIGKNCTIGAGSIITKDIPDNCIVAGIPAKIIGRNKK